MDGKVKAQRAQSCFLAAASSWHTASTTSTVSSTGPAAPQALKSLSGWKQLSEAACPHHLAVGGLPLTACWMRSPQQSWAAQPPATFLLSSPQGAGTLACLGSREAPVPLSSSRIQGPCYPWPGPAPTLLHESPQAEGACPVQPCLACGQEGWQPVRTQSKQLFGLTEGEGTHCPVFQTRCSRRLGLRRLWNDVGDRQC